MSLPWQQGSAPQHWTWFHWIGHPRKPPGRRKHLWSICHTSRLTRLIGDFVQLQIWGSTFWALEGINQKSKKTVLQSATWKTDGQKMARFHRQTKKKKQFGAPWQTDRQTEIQTTKSTTKNKYTPSLGAEINNNRGHVCVMTDSNISTELVH